MIALGALIYRLWFGPLRGRPTIISKINTAAQLLYLTAVMLGAASSFPPYGVRRALALVVLATTIVSGFNYVQAFTRRAWSSVEAHESENRRREAERARTRGDGAQGGNDAKRTA
jgi:phosphatidylglycerophosphate synthase